MPGLVTLDAPVASESGQRAARQMAGGRDQPPPATPASDPRRSGAAAIWARAQRCNTWAGVLAPPAPAEPRRPAQTANAVGRELRDERATAGPPPEAATAGRREPRDEPASGRPLAEAAAAGRRESGDEPATGRPPLAPPVAGPAPEAAAVTILRLALLLMVLVGIGAAGGYATAASADKLYAARSEVAFDLRDLAWGAAERFMATQAVIARSRSVLSPIGAALDIPVEELEGHFEVDTIGSSDVVRLQYADPRATLALDGTRALTDRYLAELRALGGKQSTRYWLLTPAYLLDDPIAPKPLQAAALGALAGLLVGIVVLLLRALARPAR